MKTNTTKVSPAKTAEEDEQQTSHQIIGLLFIQKNSDTLCHVCFFISRLIYRRIANRLGSALPNYLCVIVLSVVVSIGGRVATLQPDNIGENNVDGDSVLPAAVL